MPEEISRRCSDAGIEIVVPGSARYPRRLSDDPDAPAVLFARGDPRCVDDVPAVALVGTRSATGAGRQCAFDMGATLASAGVGVVSGLAPGIDVEALSGAVSAEASPAISVLGTAHDGLVRVDQRRLASALCAGGAVVSELPPTVASSRWRFAVRNRVIAALCDLVVVVESHERGGAFHTVAHAQRRGIPVAAVPGSSRSSASEGSNALLVSGALCVRDGADVVDLLGRVGRLARDPAGRRRPRRADGGLGLSSEAAGILGAVGSEPTTLDSLVLRSGKPLGQVALALEELAEAGFVRAEGGFWMTR